MKIHELKIQSEYFNSIVSGKKSFEVRVNDREYQKGDLLALNEMEGAIHTGKCCLVYVDYILDNENFCKEGTVVMSIKPCYVHASEGPIRDFKMHPDYSVPMITEENFYSKKL